jgi:hypothetical protein
MNKLKIIRLPVMALIFSVLAACGGGGDGGSGDGSNGDGGGSNTALIDSTRASLSNKSITYSIDLTGGNLITTNEIILCGSGEYDLQETRIFTFSGTESFDTTFGTWSVSAQGDVIILDLVVENTSDSSLTLQSHIQFAVQVDANGSVFVDGHQAVVQDASAYCAAQQP